MKTQNAVRPGPGAHIFSAGPSEKIGGGGKTPVGGFLTNLHTKHCGLAHLETARPSQKQAILVWY
jgi:hypothetical protein